MISVHTQLRLDVDHFVRFLVMNQPNDTVVIEMYIWELNGKETRDKLVNTRYQSDNSPHPTAIQGIVVDPSVRFLAITPGAVVDLLSASSGTCAKHQLLGPHVSCLGGSVNQHVPSCAPAQWLEPYRMFQAL